jgi:hypothetical protein
MSTAEPPAEPKKKRDLTAVVLIVCGLVGVVLGIMRMQRGIKEFVGSVGDPEMKRLLAESDQAIDDANKLMLDAAPLFQQLMNEIDRWGLDGVRQQKQELAQQVSERFGKAAGMLRTAAQEVDDAAERNVADKLKPFLAEKSQAYRLTADACARNQEIVALVLDKSIATLADLMPKIEAVAMKRDAAQKAAADASAKADEAARQFQSPAKS